MTRTEGKIIRDRKQLKESLAALPRPFVFTNGCFDILHRGHVSYLQDTARLGPTVIVGVNSDASVKRLKKGSGRPINPLEDRMVLLAALACVSLVVPFDADTPLDLIKTIRPDYLVKGGDWNLKDIVGADLVRSYSGQVHSIPIRYHRSTTDLIKRIREHG